MTGFVLLAARAAIGLAPGLATTPLPDETHAHSDTTHVTHHLEHL